MLLSLFNTFNANDQVNPCQLSLLHFWVLVVGPYPNLFVETKCFGLFLQMNRLINACAQQQVRQTKCRKEILNDECVSKRIIVSYVGMTAGDYFSSLLDPTIRALKGPWTANEAGLKGVK